MAPSSMVRTWQLSHVLVAQAFHSVLVRNQRLQLLDLAAGTLALAILLTRTEAQMRLTKIWTR